MSAPKQSVEDGVRLAIGAAALLGFPALRVLLLLERVDQAGYLLGSAAVFAVYAAATFGPRLAWAERVREARRTGRLSRVALRTPPRRRVIRARSP